MQQIKCQIGNNLISLNNTAYFRKAVPTVMVITNSNIYIKKTIIKKNVQLSHKSFTCGYQHIQGSSEETVPFP